MASVGSLLDALAYGNGNLKKDLVLIKDWLKLNFNELKNGFNLSLVPALINNDFWVWGGVGDEALKTKIISFSNGYDPEISKVHLGLDILRSVDGTDISSGSVDRNLDYLIKNTFKQDENGGFNNGRRFKGESYATLYATHHVIDIIKDILGMEYFQDILGKDVAVKHLGEGNIEKVIRFIMNCYHPKTGGFGEIPEAEFTNMSSTDSAFFALRNLEQLENIKENIVKYIEDCLNDGGKGSKVFSAFSENTKAHTTPHVSPTYRALRMINTIGEASLIKDCGEDILDFLRYCWRENGNIGAFANSPKDNRISLIDTNYVLTCLDLIGADTGDLLNPSQTEMLRNFYISEYQKHHKIANSNDGDHVFVPWEPLNLYLIRSTVRTLNLLGKKDPMFEELFKEIFDVGMLKRTITLKQIPHINYS